MKTYCYVVFFFVILGCQAPNRREMILFQMHENQIKAWAYFYQGAVYEGEQKWVEAAESFYWAAILDPESPRIYTHLARCLLRLNFVALAMESLKRAEKYAQMDDYLLYFDIGTVYHEARSFSDALRCYRKSLAIFPGFQKGAQALADLSNQINRLSYKEQLCR
jgi:tetratricopeptide (TPR) repeat protein